VRWFHFQAPFRRRSTLIATRLLPVFLALAAAGIEAAEPVPAPVAEAVARGVASGRDHFDHGLWDRLLRNHVDAEGRVDYQGLVREADRLATYLGATAQADLAALSRSELLALLVNAYNACTVRLVVDAYAAGRRPGSLRDLPDPWGRPACRLGGEALSLDAIEHGLLRPLFRDTRLHAALNCGARGCPRLRSEAFTGPEADRQLQQAMESMVNSETHVRVERGALRLSRIFDWYRADFVSPDFQPRASDLPRYLMSFARPELRRRMSALGAEPRIEFLEYDWSLNCR
jgi:hypothetical protein